MVKQKNKKSQVQGLRGDVVLFVKRLERGEEDIQACCLTWNPVSGQSCKHLSMNSYEEFPGKWKNKHISLVLTGKGISCIKEGLSKKDLPQHFHDTENFMIIEDDDKTVIMNTGILKKLVARLMIEGIFVSSVHLLSETPDDLIDFSKYITGPGFQAIESQSPILNDSASESIWRYARSVARGFILLLAFTGLAGFLLAQSAESHQQVLKSTLADLEARSIQYHSMVSSEESATIFNHGYALSPRLAELFAGLPEDHRIVDLYAYPVHEEAGGKFSLNDSNWLLLSSSLRHASQKELRDAISKIPWVRDIVLEELESGNDTELYTSWRIIISSELKRA